jgi:hypothetical protein
LNNNFATQPRVNSDSPSAPGISAKFVKRWAVVFNPNFSANSAFDGSTSIDPSGKTIVGMLRWPLLTFST